MSDKSMQVEESRYLKIRFNDGTERNFAFKPLDTDTDVLGRVHKMLESRRLMLEMNDRIIIIPFDNIVSVEVAPKPQLIMNETIVVLHEFDA